MIVYEDLQVDVFEVLETLAYRLLRYENPTWYSIPEEKVAQLLRSEGIDAYVED